MKIKWFGHASFLIESEDGVRIITDPYQYGIFGLKYDPINESADVVTLSHGHGDHNAFGEVKGKPAVVDSVTKTQIEGIDITGIACYHDQDKGTQRGDNIIFCFDIDGMRLCHLGDLGHLLSDGQVADIGQVDVLLIPVGGKFTLDTDAADRVCEQVKPKVVTPMHVKNAKCSIAPFTADDFAEGKSNVRHIDAGEVEIKKDDLPADTEILILEPSR